MSDLSLATIYPPDGAVYRHVRSFTSSKYGLRSAWIGAVERLVRAADAIASGSAVDLSEFDTRHQTPEQLCRGWMTYLSTEPRTPLAQLIMQQELDGAFPVPFPVVVSRLVPVSEPPETAGIEAASSLVDAAVTARRPFPLLPSEPRVVALYPADVKDTVYSGGYREEGGLILVLNDAPEVLLRMRERYALLPPAAFRRLGVCHMPKTSLEGGPARMLSAVAWLQNCPAVRATSLTQTERMGPQPGGLRFGHAQAGFERRHRFAWAWTCAAIQAKVRNLLTIDSLSYHPSPPPPSPAPPRYRSATLWTMSTMQRRNGAMSLTAVLAFSCGMLSNKPRLALLLRSLGASSPLSWSIAAAFTMASVSPSTTSRVLHSLMCLQLKERQCLL